MARKSPWTRIKLDDQLPLGRPILLGDRRDGTWVCGTVLLAPSTTTAYVLARGATHWAELPSWIVGGPPPSVQTQSGGEK